LRFWVDSNPQNLTTEEYYDEDPGRNLFGQSDGNVSTVMIDGVSSFRFVPIVTFAGEVVLVIPRAEDFLRIVDQGASFQNSGLFDKIVGTLQLLR
jgi:hypothetical protein